MVYFVVHFGVGVAVAALTALVAYLYSARARALPLPEISPFVPFFGHLLAAAKHHDHFIQWAEETANRIGSSWYVSIPGKPPMICIAPNPDNAEHVLKKNFGNYVKPPDANEMLADLLGHGIFTTDGDDWLYIRKTVSPMFSLRLLKDMIPVFTKQSQLLVNRLNKLNPGVEAIDLHDMFFRYTLTAFAEISFGQDIDGINNDVPFASAFDRAQFGIAQRGSDALLWKWKRAFSLGSREPGVTKAVKLLDEFSYAAVRDRRQQVDRGSNPDLISRFITKAEKDGIELSDKFLRDVMMNFLIAGRDTTACTLSWTFHCLSQHPEVMKKCMEEVDACFAKLGEEEVTMEFVNELVYMDAVLHESLRLYPAVPIDIKYALGDDTLPDGTHIPAHTRVMYSPWIFGRSEKLWGANASKFVPERWLGQPEPSQYLYIAFNAGPRLCMGKYLALIEAKIVMAMMLRQFTFQVVPGQTVHQARSITLHMKHGIKFTVQPRPGVKPFVNGMNATPMSPRATKSSADGLESPKA